MPGVPGPGPVRGHLRPRRLIAACVCGPPFAGGPRATPAPGMSGSRGQGTRTAWDHCASLSGGHTTRSTGGTISVCDWRRGVEPRDNQRTVNTRTGSAPAESSQAGGSPTVGRSVLAPGPPGVHSGVQIESNGGQLRATQTALARRTPPEVTGSLRLGAGRSQVQILSPRYEVPGNRKALFCGSGVQRVHSGCNSCNASITSVSRGAAVLDPLVAPGPYRTRSLAFARTAATGIGVRTVGVPRSISPRCPATNEPRQPSKRVEISPIQEGRSVAVGRVVSCGWSVPSLVVLPTTGVLSMKS
jgi:hypothetical protein